MYPFIQRFCAAILLFAAASARAQVPVLKITGPETVHDQKKRKEIYNIEQAYFGDHFFAEIYTHYATPQQQRRLITLQLSKASGERVAYIGEFNF